MGESRRSLVIAVTVATLMVGGSIGVGAAVLVGGGVHEEMTMPVYPGGEIDLASLPPSVTAHYHFAADHPRVYQQVPCFCGCDATLEHRSLLNCYVRPDGGWERHASGCAVCIDESRMIRTMLARGSPVSVIRAEVTEAYTMDVA